MKSRRLFNREIYFFILVIIIILMPVLIVGGKKYFNRSFEYYLKNKDINKLYTFIRMPSFSKKVFEEYIKYNFEGDIQIVEKKEMNDYTFLTVKTDKFEKIIILQRKDGKTTWEFNDFSKPYTITAPVNTKVFIEDMVYISTQGEIKIENMPFGLYRIEAILENCKPFKSKILSGQNFRINMELNEDAVEACKNIIQQYQKFYMDSINTSKIQTTNIVDKDSGIFNEIIDEINWNKDSKIKVNKILTSCTFGKAILDDSNQINITAKEQWEIKIDDGNKVSKKTEKYNKSYILTNQNPKIIQIITR